MRWSAWIRGTEDTPYAEGAQPRVTSAGRFPGPRLGADPAPAARTLCPYHLHSLLRRHIA